MKACCYVRRWLGRRCRTAKLTNVNIPLTHLSASSGSVSSYALAESSHAASRTTFPSLFFRPMESMNEGLVTGCGCTLYGRSLKCRYKDGVSVVFEMDSNGENLPNPVPDVQQSKRA